MTENMTESTSKDTKRWEIVVPGIAFYSPPIRCERASEALRRAKQIAAAHKHATVDLYRDGEPVFAGRREPVWRMLCRRDAEPPLERIPTVEPVRGVARAKPAASCGESCERLPVSRCVPRLTSPRGLQWVRLVANRERGSDASGERVVMRRLEGDRT